MTIPGFTATARSANNIRQSSGAGALLATWAVVRRASELVWVLSGKFVLLGANGALMLYLAHRLELDTYGVLVLTIGLQLLLSRLLMLGVDVGMIRFSRTSELRHRSHQVVAAGLIVILGATCALLLVSLVTTPVLAWFRIPLWVPLSVVAGAIGTSLVDYVYSVRLVRNEYPLAAVAQGGTSIFRLGVTVLANVLLPSSTLIVFITYHGASLLSGMAQTIGLSKVSRPWPDRELIRRLVRYSLWQGKTNVLVIVGLYQGTFLLMLLGQQAATGIFGLGLTLSLGFLAIYNAFFEYLLARIGSVKNIHDLPRFMKRAFGASFTLSIACVPLVVGVAVLVPWLLRPELSEVIPIFYYLAASTILLIHQAPLEVASHYLLRPQLVSFVWLMRAVLIAIPGFMLASAMGVRGAAIAQLIGSGLALFVLAALVHRAFRRAAEAASVLTDAGGSAELSGSRGPVEE